MPGTKKMHGPKDGTCVYIYAYAFTLASPLNTKPLPFGSLLGA